MSILDCLMWMAFGALVVVCMYGIFRYLKTKNFSTGKFAALMILGAITDLLLVFTLTWAYLSVLEGEFQAVGMGFIFFGGATLVFAILTFRLATLKPKSERSVDVSQTPAEAVE